MVGGIGGWWASRCGVGRGCENGRVDSLSWRKKSDFNRTAMRTYATFSKLSNDWVSCFCLQEFKKWPLHVWVGNYFCLENIEFGQQFFINSEGRKSGGWKRFLCYVFV